jgi:Phosphotransferase enzyme family
MWISESTYAGLTQVGHEEWAKGADQRIDDICALLSLTPIASLSGGIKGVVLTALDADGSLCVLKTAPADFLHIELELLHAVAGRVPHIIQELPEYDAFIMQHSGTALGDAGIAPSAEELATIIHSWSETTPPDNLPEARELMTQWIEESAPLEDEEYDAISLMLAWAERELERVPVGYNTVHGDLHANNLLVSAEGRITTIDPIGMKGTLECEIGHACMFYADADTAAFVREVCFVLDADYRQALQWTAIRCAISASACHKRGQEKLHLLRTRKWQKLAAELETLL